MISVGIPVYNQAEYLPDAIESALSQTEQCEILVCNDGSTDNSLEIAKHYNVKVIDQVNKGLPSARNTLIMNMTGEYFLPLDADDILKENCIEKLQKEIDEHHADVVAPSFREFGVSNQDVILGPFTLEDLKVANRIPYFSAIKRDVLLEIGGYNPKMIFGYEDWDIWFDIFKRKHSISVLQDVLVLYRTKEKSMIHTANEHREELMEQMRKNHSDIW